VFTDGLIERRDEDIDHGQARLLATLPRLAEGDLHEALAHLAASMRDATRDDDVAALAVRRHGS
jgi:thioredoxin-like negative regulator of GroEL